MQGDTSFGEGVLNAGGMLREAQPFTAHPCYDKEKDRLVAFSNGIRHGEGQFHPPRRRIYFTAIPLLRSCWSKFLQSSISDLVFVLVGIISYFCHPNQNVQRCESLIVFVVTNFGRLVHLSAAMMLQSSDLLAHLCFVPQKGLSMQGPCTSGSSAERAKSCSPRPTKLACYPSCTCTISRSQRIGKK